MSAAQNGTPQSSISEALGGNGKGAVYPAMNNFVLFAQDDFQFSNQLTLNLGLRINSADSLITVENGRTSTFACTPRACYELGSK
jgi:hypothetical protein